MPSIVLNDKHIKTIKELITDWGFEYGIKTKIEDVIELAKEIGMNSDWIKRNLEI